MRAARGRALRERRAVERRARTGDPLYHVPGPARVADLAKPLPGTQWAPTADGGLDLVVADSGTYARFLFSGSGGRRQWCP
ncbi:MAG: hypothetical protein ACYDEA_03455 [Candidatus Dormibacteria bacterium]